jgi:hypothetical protein
MLGTLLYLTVCTFRNRLRIRFRRMRQPRYLIGSVAGALYFYFIFFAPRRRRRSAGTGPMPQPPPSLRGAIEAAGSVALFLLVALAWIWPSKGPALAFTPAEVQFLFTAPIARRTLVTYRIARSLLGNLFMGVVMTLVFRPPSAERGWILFAGTTIAFAIVNVHLMGVSLSRASLRQHGVSGLARQWLPLSLLAAILVIVGVTIGAHWATLSRMGPTAELARELERLLTTGAAGIALWPFRVIARLPMSPTAGEFFRDLPAVLAIFALNFGWVLRSDTAFEEASAASAEKIAARRVRGAVIATPRVRRTTAPFTLGVEGRPEIALLWKNLILIGRYASLRTLLRVLPAIAVMGMMVSFMGRDAGKAWPTIAAMMALMFAFVATLFGPQIARNDLRQDLSHLAILRTWPVRGSAIVRGEILAPTVVLSAVVLVCLACAAALSGHVPFLTGVSLADRMAFAAAALALSPGIIVTQITLQNGLAVMFPAWVGPTNRGRQGFDVMGQRILLVYGMLLGLAIALVPAAAAAALIAYPVSIVTGRFPVLLPALVASVVLFVQAGLVATLLGRMFDRTDVGALDAAE